GVARARCLTEERPGRTDRLSGRHGRAGRLSMLEARRARSDALARPGSGFSRQATTDGERRKRIGRARSRWKPCAARLLVVAQGLYHAQHFFVGDETAAVGQLV